jgi:hypothetical protein
VKLGTINRVLRFFGFVLVVEVDLESGNPTEMRVERWRRYLARTRT